MQIPWRTILAEFVATFALVVVGAGSAIVAGSAGSGLVGVALAHGFILAAMISITAHVSGGVANPALVLALWVVGKLPSVMAGLYAGAQLAGAIAGALLLRLSVPGPAWRVTRLGTPIPSPDVGGGKAILVEAVLTFVLALVYVGTVVDDRGPFARTGGLPVGLTLAALMLVGWPLTGAATNPARVFGPGLISGTWTSWWAYWIGPAAGAVIGTAVYWAAFLREPEPGGRAAP